MQSDQVDRQTFTPPEGITDDIKLLFADSSPRYSNILYHDVKFILTLLFNRPNCA